MCVFDRFTLYRDYTVQVWFYGKNMLSKTPRLPAPTDNGMGTLLKNIYFLENFPGPFQNVLKYFIRKI